MNKYIFIVGVYSFSLFSCSQRNEREHLLQTKVVYESFLEAKASFPGLGCLKDTFAIQILIPNTDIGYREFLYSGSQDTLWSPFIQRMLDGISMDKDTTLYSGQGEKTDTIIQFGHYKAIPSRSDSIFIFPPNGFQGEEVDIFVNKNVISFNLQRPEAFMIPKSKIDSLGLRINNLEPFYIEVNKEYNIIHIFKLDDTLLIKMVYVF